MWILGKDDCVATFLFFLRKKGGVMQIDTTNFIKSTDPDEVYNFVAGANFAMRHIISGNEKKAKSYGASYQFAKDNEQMDSSEFATESGKLLNELSK